MGKRGIQLSVFFIMSLMLFAAVFSPAVMAAKNDAKGIVEAAWRNGGVSTGENIFTAGTINSTQLLPAGSKVNMLRFTYKAIDDKGTTDTGDDTPINMAGGRFRITFPAGWTVSKKNIQVVDGDLGDDNALGGTGDDADNVIYQTDADGDVDTTVGTADSRARVTFNQGGISKNITVALDNAWVGTRIGPEIQRALYIILADVTAVVPTKLGENSTNDSTDDLSSYRDNYATSTFEASSSARNGTLIRLAAGSPSIRVGNIIADRNFASTADYTGRDPLERKLSITPDRVFSEETDLPYNLIFSAPGPMYGAELKITVPTALQPALYTTANIVGNTGTAVKTISVTERGGATLGTKTIDSQSNILTIQLLKIDIGQEVVVNYQVDGTNIIDDLTARVQISATTSVTVNNVPQTDQGTKIAGGAAHPEQGSGKVTLVPSAMEQGSLRRNMTVTYTAYTKLENANIAIQSRGLVIDLAADPVQRLQKDDSAGYGYVFGDKIDDVTINTAGDQITWNGITLKKNESVKLTIKQVNVSKVVGQYPWPVTVVDVNSDGSTRQTGGTLMSDDYADADGDVSKGAGDELPILSVLQTSRGNVTFKIVDNKPLRALSEETIVFRFTADKTTIRNGWVSFTIPAALGSAPTTKDKTPGGVDVAISGGVLAHKYKDSLVSGRTIKVNVKRLDVSGTVTVTYGNDKPAVLHYEKGKIKIPGTFRSSANSGTRTAGDVEIELGNVLDGTGDVELQPFSIEAGGSTGAITVTYTAEGTMDGGQVSLEIPAGWGAMQNDPTLLNYVKVLPVGVATSTEPDIGDSGRSRVIAKIKTLAKGGKIQFIYGGGTGDPSERGVEVQDTVGIAEFTVKSDGDGDGVFAHVVGTEDQTAKEKIRNPDKIGKIYKDGTDGQLRIRVTSAMDGTGKAEVAPKTVRAADETTLTFTYQPTQTIIDGQLKLTVPSSWSMPQVSEVSGAGYTEVEGIGLGAVTDDGKGSLIVEILTLDPENKITIKYGTASGKAVASPTAGKSPFTIRVKGHANGTLKALPRPALTSVTVNPQGSGKGSAMAAVTDGRGALGAGDKGRQFTITYTAAGQVEAGTIQVSIPAKWSAPGPDTVTVTPASLVPEFEAQMIEVTGVSLAPKGKVTFVYTGDLQPEPGTPAFGVKMSGGLATDTPDGVSGDDDDGVNQLQVEVGEASPGSGEGMVSPKIVQAGDTGVEIEFTYIAAGTMSSPREVWVQVPRSWTAPTNMDTAPENKGTYTVEHSHKEVPTTASVEKIDPTSGGKMRARMRIAGLEVEAGDKIIFTYQNADAPANPELSAFIMGTDNEPITDKVYVRVQSTMPSQLSVSSAGTVSADAGAMPLALTVGLADAAGTMVAMEADASVTLTSSSAGTFAMTADGVGTESLTVTIPGGEVSTMAYYMDATPGSATISASAPGLTMASHAVTVTTTVVEIDAGSVTVSPTLAMAGDTVTVSATGTPGRAVTFSVGTIVTDKAMTETANGSYSGSFMVVADQHADGTYDVTVALNGQSDTAAGALTLDSTMPTVTASASPETVMNGDTVMVSATATDTSAISSVMADVSALDSTQTSVALTMGADGAYSASVTISKENEALNGSKTITVTATDAAGNSGTGTAMVMLDNKLSYTSMISEGTSLFHVPLDVEGLDTVGDLKAMLGDAANLLIVYDSAAGSWNSRSDDVAITADLGIIALMTADTTAEFTGDPWDGGTSTLNLMAGSNLVGLPLNDPRVTNVSDIAGLFAAGVVTSVVISTDDGFAAVDASNDGPVMGDAAYLVTASADATAALVGEGWSNGTAAAAPIGLLSHRVEGQTPVLDLTGSVVDEITGAVQEGFRVKVKNLSTKAALSEVTTAESAEGYNMTFVDLKDAHAARVGDVLEISADSPNPLMGVQPVRHIVTVDDVKASRIELEALIAYEIPAETELLRNYPNPFNPETWIPYRLAEDADVSLTIYDVNGELVRTIDIGYQNAAVYESRSKAIYWDGRNRLGEQVASGVYFYSLSAGDFSATRKMVILK